MTNEVLSAKLPTLSSKISAQYSSLEENEVLSEVFLEFMYVQLFPYKLQLI